MRKKAGTGSSLWKIPVYAVLIFWALTTIYPLFWVAINSFKVKNEILANSFSLPVGDLFTLANYKRAFERVPILGAYANSLILSGTVTVAVMALAGLAAFALVRYQFKGRDFLMSVVVGSMMFPAFSTIVPVFRMEASWGLVNTSNRWISLFSCALPQIAGNLSFAIIVLSGYIRSLPIELEEAAYMEGCSTFKIFTRIVVPMAKPSFATVAIFSFLWSYNDLFTQTFFLRIQPQWAITRLLKELTAMEGTNYGLMAAAVTIVVVPVIIVYAFLQKYIIKGMTAGAIKG
ncbi:ABC transporter, permease protein [Marvinbryantia formatexigens DSM 14469]|uniref:ABC transporter, permease protein n=1 Tax=Marvinbryantia formatexigens DSM 14469 TaxID=478749 RepID=C6LFB0_9FIRM|nr:carbohydrate ABC transporter permease [Marvinbryantia formatexigens]EET60849.1 ABC transporter, permease protein [Marvinbryantia formatexigens DSM 14469]UWO26825.1 carbohydrate ABC transporter permease [Marvinbryantia formatexigens DSM 14469]SDH21111.1 raffinose/stachyose/melibiose transport system permease protein [Marvinbryantia formatexigens]